MRTLLVTVGSTKFDVLIQAISMADDNFELKKFVSKFEIEKIIIQHGRSPAPKIKNVPINDVEVVDYIVPERMSQLLSTSTVIISHGGAGTIFEILRCHGPALEALVVVENEKLMDSHQSELIDALISMECPLQRASGNLEHLFNNITCKRGELSSYNLPEPDFRPLVSLINSWL